MTLDASELVADDILSPAYYAEHGYPHSAWRALREQAPLRHFDLGARPGFWAVVRRADVVWLSRQPERFLNSPRLAVVPDSPDPDQTGGERFFRHLLNMDPPEHGQYRNVASSWFTPRAIAGRRGEIERIADELIEGMRAKSSVDFVRDFTAPLTLSVLADMLGVPGEDWQRMFAWTNQLAGPGDPEYQVGGNATETMKRTLDEMFPYLLDLVEQRRSDPRDDMVSVLAHAEINGEPMPRFELLSYLSLLIVAGNETTRNAASGGLMALIERPEEFARLAASPELVPTAVEETVRFASPVNQFCRTPVEDVEIHGQKIRAGESLCLFYASANRDEAVFEAPDEFRIDRKPNPHVGFGIGEHFCLGANLARLELRVIYERLLPKLRSAELAGPVERVRSSFLPGVKRMPIRCEWRD